jgi:osmotically-inducible protein OsmY
MKLSKNFVWIAPLLLAAGCSSNYDDRYGRYGSEPTYSGPVTSPSQRTTTSYPIGGTRISTPPSTATQGAAAATQIYSETDLALGNLVRQQLLRYGDLSTAAQGIQIMARNGTVQLTGSVPSERDRQLIDTVVRNTPGVLAVNDQMQISTARSVPTYGQSDQTLANQLQQTLATHPTLAGFANNVRVAVQNGRVTLSGNVPSEQDRQMITEAVRNTPGVVSISDQMQIATLPTGRVSQGVRVYPSTGAEMINLHVQGLSETDRSLAQRMLEGLRTDATFAPPTQPIDITIANGQITLQGAVQSSEQKRDIAAAVQRAAGAGTVFDDLQVVKTP